MGIRRTGKRFRLLLNVSLALSRATAIPVPVDRESLIGRNDSSRGILRPRTERRLARDMTDELFLTKKKKKKKKYSTGTENCKSFIRSCTAKNSSKAKKKKKRKESEIDRQT